MVTEFKFTVVHFARPGPLKRKTWKIGTWPPDHRAAGPSMAAGPLVLRAAGDRQKT